LAHPLFLQPDALRALAQLFWKRLTGAPTFQVGAVETAAIPLLTAILLYAPPERGAVNGFIIRKSRKLTGRGNAIEGLLTTDPVVLLDDIINSGRSADKARAILADAGHPLSAMFVVIDYLSVNGLAWRATNTIQVESLFSLDQFDLGIETSAPSQPKQTYTPVWSNTVPGGFAYHVVPKSAPLLVGTSIYRGCDAALMHAFDAATGRVLWEFRATGTAPTKGIWSSPAYHDGVVYFGAYNGVMYALDAATGREIWSKAMGEWIGASPVIVPEHSLLYIGVEHARPWAQGSLCAVDLATGEKVWERLVRKLQHGSPAYYRSGDLVIWGSADHETLGMDAKTGSIAWSLKTGRSVKCAPAVCEARGLTAFASFDKRIYLADARTGEQRGCWETGDLCYTAPLFYGNRLFCGSGDRRLYVIDLATLDVTAKLDFGARIYSTPVAVSSPDGDRILFGTNGGRVIELDARTLETRVSHQCGDAVTNSIAVSPDQQRIYVSTTMNQLHCLQRP
jgi:outer membrane protein assembly factor BamB/orotate phosphoribosyltransferase